MLPFLLTVGSFLLLKLNSLFSLSCVLELFDLHLELVQLPWEHFLTIEVLLLKMGKCV